MQAINSQKFEEAADHRDMERKLQDDLERKSVNGKSKPRSTVKLVGEENVAEVVAMMTGIPVQRIAKNESDRLMNMEAELESSVIGQEDAIKKVVQIDPQKSCRIKGSE